MFHLVTKMTTLFKQCLQIAVVSTMCLTANVWACPFCSAPSLTLTEQVDQSEVVLLAVWQDSKRGDAENPGLTTFKLAEIVKNKGAKLKVGDTIQLKRYRSSKAGQKMLLMGTMGDEVIEWDSPLEVSELSYNYIRQAPAPDLPVKKRLVYYMKFLEFPDDLISNDAYAEFANAPYEDIAPLSEHMPREKLRGWVKSAYSTNPKDQIKAATLTTRMGLYGLLLGLCGKEEDIKILESKITEQTTDFRLGIDGIMAGYLLLTKEKGLNLIEETKLKPLEDEVPFSETYSAMQALRFMWNYGDGRISKDRLRQSMRVLLKRKELADLVIADLSRWQDWSVQEHLFKIYGAEGYDIPAVRRAIIRFFLNSIRNGTKDESEATQKAAQEAKKYLDELRKKDPKTVEQAERFFLLD